MLATPLTVCLVVLAKHAPDLDFITVLLADQPVLAPDVSFYQRLLAADPDEATEIVEAYLKSHPLGAAYDAVILPALSQAKCDRQRGRITADGGSHPGGDTADRRRAGAGAGCVGRAGAGFRIARRRPAPGGAGARMPRA